MAREKSPAFQFYPRDFETDENVKAMELEEVGAYMLLMCTCWSEGSIPADLGRLARLLKIPAKRMDAIWPALAPCFAPGDDGRLVHPRLDAERAKQAANRAKRAKAGRASGQARKANNPKADDEQPANTCSTEGATQTNLASAVCSLPTTYEQQQHSDSVESGAERPAPKAKRDRRKPPSNPPANLTDAQTLTNRVIELGMGGIRPADYGKQAARAAGMLAKEHLDYWLSAAEAMPAIWPYSKARPWDVFDLAKDGAKALAAKLKGSPPDDEDAWVEELTAGLR